MNLAVSINRVSVFFVGKSSMMYPYNLKITDKNRIYIFLNNQLFNILILKEA
jgi:hypothetical protein